MHVQRENGLVKASKASADPRRGGRYSFGSGPSPHHKAKPATVERAATLRCTLNAPGRSALGPCRRNVVQPTVARLSDVAKRKRDDASESTTQREADVEEQARPRKRGRPRKSTDGNEDSTTRATAREEEQPARKRGRRANGPDEPAEAASQVKKKRGRGRPSLEEQRRRNAAEAEGDPEPEKRTSKKTVAAKEQQPKKRGRPRKSLEGEPDEQPDQEDENQQNSTSLRDLRPEAIHNQAEDSTTPRPRGTASKRQQTAAPGQSESRDTEAPRRRGRPKGSRNSTAGADTSTADTSHLASHPEAGADEQAARPKKFKRKPGRPSTGEPSRNAADHEDEGNDDDDDDDGDDEAASPASPAKPYLHVASRTRTVRPSTIESKWAPLTEPSIAAASSILQLAHQPILQHTATARNRRAHAAAALTLVSRRISRKLARGLPFPPAAASSSAAATTTHNSRGRPSRLAAADAGRAAELDFESVLGARQLLERQLEPSLHAVALLRVERAKLERELERDYGALRSLEAGARGQARERNDLLRKAHVLAPRRGPTAATDGDDEKEREFMAAPATGDTLADDVADTELEPLVQQLAGHVSSIRGNLQQAEGIAPQLARSRAALQDVLLRTIDQETYETIMLGQGST